MLAFLPEALKADYRHIRKGTCYAFGKLGVSNATTRKHLERAIRKDRDTGVRKVAILALGMLRCRESGPFLCGILRDRKALTGIRTVAAIALGMMQEPANIPILAQWAGGKRERKPEVRAGAVMGLGQIGGDRAAAYLLSLLQRWPRDEARGLTVSALANIEGPVIQLGEKGRGKAIIPARVFERLLRDRNERPEVRGSAALALGKKGDGRSIAELKRSARLDSEDIVRGFSAVSLGELAQRIPGEQARISDFLARTLSVEKSRHVRPFFLLALGLTGDARRIPILQRSFQKENSRARGAAAVALGLLKDRSAMKLLGTELTVSKSVWKVRWFSAQGLGLIGGPEAIRILRQALVTGGTERIKMAAIKGLAVCGDRTTIPMLIESTRSRNRVVQEWAVSSLGYFQDLGAVTRLIEVAEKERTPSVRALAVLSLGNICEKWEERPILCGLADHVNWLAARKFRTVSLLLRLSAWPG
jgi:HEAT repeat protein